MKPSGIVIATGRARLMRRHATELGRPQHQRVFQQSRLFQIGQQRRGGLVEDRAVAFVVRLERLVGIPIQQPVDAGSSRRAIQIHVANVAFQQPAGQQAVAGVGRLQRVLHPPCRTAGASPRTRATGRTTSGAESCILAASSYAATRACRSLSAGLAAAKSRFKSSE